MKAISAAAILGLTLAGTLAPASAQYYGGGGGDYGGPGYRDRGGDYGYQDRGYDRRDRDDYDDRGRRGGQRGDYAFDEQEYLRCNPDVRRAIINGQMTSGLAHYRKFGIREGRRLTC